MSADAGAKSLCNVHHLHYNGTTYWLGSVQMPEKSSPLNARRSGLSSERVVVCNLHNSHSEKVPIWECPLKFLEEKATNKQDVGYHKHASRARGACIDINTSPTVARNSRAPASLY